MSETFNIYCDESCHLENDRQPVMVLGAIWCQLDYSQEGAKRIREIKAKHGFNPKSELKWTKVSPGNLRLYLDVLDFFFDTDHLSFRALIADKTTLSHASFGQTHDEWYYKMYFDMLKWILQPDACFRVYMDIKDTQSATKVRTLHDVLANNLYDFSRDIVERVQTVRSQEVELLQLADILIGAVSSINRGVTKSLAKQALIERTRERSRYSLTRSTLLQEKKFNLFHWRGAGRIAQ